MNSLSFESIVTPDLEATLEFNKRRTSPTIK